jgi:hypothetical protein
LHRVTLDNRKHYEDEDEVRGTYLTGQ